jgi:hypothetical protein|tara:strand:+ start:447 stop:761 length:315 start_codon:yes stop_codon:yes gene_type:complete
METFITDINRSANRGSRIETWKPGYKPTSEETEIMTNENTAVVAWIPTKEEHLTLAGVHAIGGRIIEDHRTNNIRQMSHSDATYIAFTLSTNSPAQGHYIPVHL